MLTVELSRQARKFIGDLQAKQKRQILEAIISLCADPNPPDCGKLTDKWRRKDVGEFRVVYAAKNTLKVLIVGKRNDDEVYRLFLRAQK